MKVITYDVGTTGFKAALYELAEKNIKLLASEVDHYVHHKKVNRRLGNSKVGG